MAQSGAFVPRGGAELESSVRCPVCDQASLNVSGLDGVIPHLLAVHADTPEARWITEQLGIGYDLEARRTLADTSPRVPLQRPPVAHRVPLTASPN
jgi:hypothetical protein